MADLYEAAKRGWVAEVKRLLEAKADVTYNEGMGDEMFGQVPVRRQWTPLHAASSNGHAKIVRMLIEASAPLDAKDNEGQTPLYIASKRRRREIVKMLIEARASVEAKDNFGRTPLYTACYFGEAEIVKMLIEARASVEVKDKRGVTPLHAAAKNGAREAVAKALISAGASVDTQNDLKNTPLHDACWIGQAETVKVLIEARSSVEAQNKDGETPLHTAARWGQTAVAEVLISAGASVDTQNGLGRTPLHCAAQKGRLSMIRMLIASGASADVMDECGVTPRECASNTATQRAIDQALLLESKYEIQVPLDRVKVFLCGDGAVGKSTLTRALQRSDLSMRLWDLPKAVDERTHGFDTFPATIPTAGTCTIVDFAGQPEYWVSSAVFMDPVSGVFVVLCKLTDPFEEQFEQLRYWVRSIGSQSRPENKPRVVLVGTHRGAAKAIQKRLEDKASVLPPLETADLKASLSRLARITEGPDGQWKCAELDAYVAELHTQLGHLVNFSPRIHYVDSVSPGKQDRAGMASLRKSLHQAMDQIRATRTMPKVCADVISFLPTVRKVLAAVAPFDAVQQELKRLVKETTIDCDNVDRVKAVFGYLTEAGHVMYFEDIGDMVVVDPQAFGTHVIGQLFCPISTKGFTSMVLTKEDGLHFRESQLTAALQHAHGQGHIFGDMAVVLRMLVALELVIPVSADLADVDPLFAVPGRLSAAAIEGAMERKYLIRPDDCWTPPHDHTQWFYAGVRLTVSESQLMIPPSLFPRLQYRLSKEPSFRMWQRGLSTRVLTDTAKVAVEGIVELDRNLEHMDVCVRSAIGDERGCIELLRRLATFCEGFDVFFNTAVITDDSMRRHDEGGRQIDRPDPDAPRLLPSQWIDARYARLLNQQELPSVFISYSSTDSDSEFKLLISTLTAHKYTVFDPKDLVDPSKAEMAARVRSSGVVLAVLSPNYFKSEWCCVEARAAMEAGVTIIPVYNGDKHLHAASGSSVMKWKTEETEETAHSDQPLRNYVYRKNVVRVVDTQGQVAAIDGLLAAIESRCSSVGPDSSV